MNKETIRIGDRVCTIYQSEMPKFLLVQPIDEHDLEVLDKEFETIQALTQTPFTLVAFEIKDWQSELTPWAAPAVFGKIPFGDKASETLAFVEDVLIPILEQRRLYDKDTLRCLLGGYSLAGLFALWASYQSTRFDGIVAASPSVWYPQWIAYAERHQPSTSAVYLSLGDKEEKARNPVMAQVGYCIRKQHELLSEQGISTILEWNPGNHFQHSDERTAKGFAWIINQLSQS